MLRLLEADATDEVTAEVRREARVEFFALILPRCLRSESGGYHTPREAMNRATGFVDEAMGRLFPPARPQSRPQADMHASCESEDDDFDALPSGL